MVEDTPFSDFDMNRDGDADELPPAFVVTAGSDLLNQTIYLHQPVPRPAVTNESDALLLTDSRCAAHVLVAAEPALARL